MNVQRLDSLLLSSNPVFTSARSGKRIPNGLVATLINPAVLLGGMLLAFFAAFLIVGDKDKANALMNTSYVLLVAFPLMVLLLTLWIHFYERRPFKSIGFVWNAGGAIRSYFVGSFIAVVMVACVVGLIALFQDVTIQNNNLQIRGMIVLGEALFAMFCFALQGGSEEIVFRGWYMPVLGARYRPWIGVLVSSVLFSVLHATPNPIVIANLFLFGLFLALYSLREGSLWSVCGWHSAWNWTMGNVFGCRVSGQASVCDSLINLQIQGHPLLTGGDYRLEGSLMATIVILLGIAIVVITYRPRGNIGVLHPVIE